jgi:hypothetical protein
MTKGTVIFYRSATDVRQFGPTGGYPDVSHRVAFDLSAMAELQMYNQSCLLAHDLVGPEDYIEVWRQVETLTNIWSIPLGAAFDEIFDGLTLLDLFSIEAAYFGREAAMSRLLVKRALDHTNARELVLCHRPQAPNKWTFFPYVFEAIALEMAQAAGLPVRFALSLSPLAVEEKYGSLLRRGLNLFKHTSLERGVSRIKQRIMPPRQRAEALFPREPDFVASTMRKCVIPVANKPDLKTALYLSKELRRRHDIETVFIAPTYEPDVAQQSKSVGAQYYVHAQFQNGIGEQTSLLSHLLEAKERFLKVAAAQYPEIFANATLARTHFSHLFENRCMNLALSQRFLVKMLETVKPDVVVVGFDWHGIPRVLVQSAKRLGIPTLSLAHSGFMIWNIFGFASDYFAAWGEGQQLRLSRFGSVKIAGSYSYDHLVNDIEQKGLENLKANSRNFIANLGIAVNKHTVLVMTANSPATLLSEIDSSQHIKTLVRLLDIPLEITDLELILKPHPRYDDYELYQVLDREGRPGVRFLTPEMPLHQLLPAARLALLVNMPTTAALEAMLYQVNDAFDNSFNQAAETPYEGMVIRDLEEIAPSIRRVIQDGPDRDKLIAVNQSFLRHWVGESDGLATQRTADLVADMIVQKHT